MFTDETGQLFLALIIAGAVVGGAFGALSAAAAGRNVLWGFVFGAVSGAVLGLLSALETPVLLMALSSGALSAVSELLQQNINNEDRNWDRIRYNAFISVAMGALGGWFGDWAKVSACLDDFCQVGLTAITDSATNAIGLGINAIIESLIK